MLTFEYPTANDASEYARVAIQTYIETYGNATIAKKIYGAKFVNETFPELLKKKHNIFVIARVDGVMVGFAKLMIQEKDNFAYLDKLYVLKDYHGKGYGLRLIQFCFQQADKLGKEQVKLSVYSENTHAIDFYHQLGFKETGEKEHYFLPDESLSSDVDLIMVCPHVRKTLQSIDEKLKTTAEHEFTQTNYLLKFGFMGQLKPSVYGARSAGFSLS